MGEYADRFQAELVAVYEAAGRPTLERLVRLGREQSPPMQAADATISGWLTGRAVPGEAHTRYFLILAVFLQGRAVAQGGRYAARPEAWWQQLLLRARQERDAARGGRPRTGGAPAVASGPVTLPPAPAGFTGRTAELDKVLGWLEPVDGAAGDTAVAVVSAVAGMGGVGKTALAVHAAHQARLRGWFPGGILFADLRGYGHDHVGVGDVADRFLRALGVKAKDLPDAVEEKIDLWRLMLGTLAAQGRPLLAVLDNVRTPGQITALLPAAPHRALVTSRHNLSALPANRVDLTPLTPGDAVDLLERTLRVGGTGDGRVTTQRAAALRLVDLCGRLPLALRIIGALLRDEPDRPLDGQARELEDERTRLDALEYEGGDGQGRPLAVRASFELSYRHLTGPQSRVFRLLAAAPGPDISTTAGAILLGQDPVDARRMLASLARAHLLDTTSAGTLADGVRERWSMHDLIRLFADGLGLVHSSEDGRDTAVARLLDHYLLTAEAADSHLETRAAEPASDCFTGRDQALDWLESERVNLVAAAIMPAARRHPAGTRLFTALTSFFNRRRYFEDGIALNTAALADYRAIGDHRREGSALNNLGNLLRQVRRFDEALDAHTSAAAIFEEIGDHHAIGMAVNNVGLVLQELRRFDDAIEVHTAALAVFRATGDSHREAMVLNSLGSALREVRRFDEAIEAHTAALAGYRAIGDHYREGSALNNLGLALQQAGHFDEAIDAHTGAAAISRETGDRHGEGNALDNLGVILWMVRRFGEAIDAHTAAAAISRETGDRHGEGIAMDNLGLALRRVRRFDEAVTMHTAAVAIYQETGDHRRVGIALNSCAIAHNERWRLTVPTGYSDRGEGAAATPQKD
ncbi:ATP-binding protein [Streptomyces sp. NPDC058086]|uniref:ATP-binding protein n=1 Tax=Streptomyces sp. NPDC058086 TaxID=3346334 RepID=UPI0036EF551A